MKDLFGDIIKTEQLSKIRKTLKGPTVVKFSDPSGQIHFLPCDKCQTWFVRASQSTACTYSLLMCNQELIDRIGKQYQPIKDLMADETRPGWELLFEDGQPATDDNWAKRLAANDFITMNLELRWKPL
jgi:hypothetical protein